MTRATLRRDLRLSAGKNDNQLLHEFVDMAEPRRGTGWASYDDSEYTSASPLSVSGGSTATLTIDGLGPQTNTAYLEDAAPIFSTANSTITGDTLGETFLCRLGFTARTTEDVFADLTGLVSALTMILLKDALKRLNTITTEADFDAFSQPGRDIIPFNGATRINRLFLIYTGDPVVSGGQFTVSPEYDTEFYDIDLSVQRIFRPES